MKPSKLYEALHALIGERVPLHIWGPCGVGKSRSWARSPPTSTKTSSMCGRCSSIQSIYADCHALPRTRPSGYPRSSCRRPARASCFLDELTSAPQMTQAGCYQLVLDRKLGEYVLPEGWVVIAAGNPASERGVHFAMPRPLRKSLRTSRA